MGKCQKKAKAFINSIKQRVITKQKIIAHHAMTDVFSHSPHIQPMNATDSLFDDINNEFANFFDIQRIMETQSLYQSDAMPDDLPSIMSETDVAKRLKHELLLSKTSTHLLFQENTSMYALSQYDANHKIFTSKHSSANLLPPTFDAGLSLVFHNQERSKINDVDDIGETIKITNIVPHNQAVEIGGPTWQRPGYFPYTKTSHMISTYYGHDVREVM